MYCELNSFVILGLNLREGDIVMPKQKSAILGNRWDISVPYELSVNLSVNYKGVIWRAFEQFRLKSCIDFKPRAAEDISYISLESRDGCWSYVGRTFAGAQALSIGDGCGTKAIVEHEFLHALGFWHEQSRYDRDDYLTINFENIITGQEHNFNKYSENQTTTQDTQYDYYSVMHYDKNAFSNGNGSTIITKRPEFQDVIGQRLDLSEYDVIELNKLYKCNSSISFLDHCSFDDESLCQMSVCSAGDYGWQRMKSVSGINVTDHTYLGKEQNGTSFFMHFSTEGRNEGDAAKMESKTMTPKRDCKVQCLQFYYYHSGHESDQLNIWIREYQNEADSRGTLRLMDQITVRKGAGNSSGGFSLDDINISETECPHTWQIRDFEKVLNNSVFDTWMYSPLYYSSDGYRFQADVSVWDNPQNTGTQVVIGNETVYVGIFWGYKYAIMKEDLTRREFIKGGDIIFLFTMQDKALTLELQIEEATRCAAKIAETNAAKTDVTSVPANTVMDEELQPAGAIIQQTQPSQQRRRCGNCGSIRHANRSPDCPAIGQKCRHGVKLNQGCKVVQIKVQFAAFTSSNSYSWSSLSHFLHMWCAAERLLHFAASWHRS
ncbi:meprin A subunit beta-like [Sinocyclocheilus rhinocerous]|uniref:meprin A subunit beta-like n=1 Tax=Sinocyclocheilus rhinocerous TaxID=307959 RepID=UPI0007B8D771|nr:PREDICTED: meprin A subunit beta-like [Sinocyclocheilus rhinocerous]